MKRFVWSFSYFGWWQSQTGIFHTRFPASALPITSFSSTQWLSIHCLYHTPALTDMFVYRLLFLNAWHLTFCCSSAFFCKRSLSIFHFFSLPIKWSHPASFWTVAKEGEAHNHNLNSSQLLQISIRGHRLLTCWYQRFCYQRLTIWCRM